MKSQLLQQLKATLNQRLATALAAMQAAQESSNAEGKSSAGDKYETTRAMGHLDREMHGRQYEQIRQERVMIERIDENQVFIKGAFGALMNTSMGWFWLTVSAGQMEVLDKKVMVISPQSPIGQLLMGKSAGDSVDFRGKNIEVLEVF